MEAMIKFFVCINWSSDINEFGRRIIHGMLEALCPLFRSSFILVHSVWKLG